MDFSTHRRTLLAGLATTLAGCSGSDSATPAESTPAGATTTSQDTASSTATAAEDETAAADETATETSASGSLDLREANVMTVAVERVDGGYRFDVTLYHDDDGEDGYANWWQVETLAGERLGRRELLHAHGTREFTRSATVAVSEGTACVVVRGHDQTHGYGGRAMVVNVGSGETRAVEQGPDPRSMADESC